MVYLAPGASTEAARWVGSGEGAAQRRGLLISICARHIWRYKDSEPATEEGAQPSSEQSARKRSLDEDAGHAVLGIGRKPCRL